MAGKAADTRTPVEELNDALGGMNIAAFNVANFVNILTPEEQAQVYKKLRDAHRDQAPVHRDRSLFRINLTINWPF